MQLTTLAKMLHAFPDELWPTVPEGVNVGKSENEKLLRGIHLFSVISPDNQRAILVLLIETGDILFGLRRLAETEVSLVSADQIDIPDDILEKIEYRAEQCIKTLALRWTTHSDTDDKNLN